MITPRKFLNLMDKEDKDIFKIGTISEIQNNKSTIIFDGESVASEKSYLSVNYNPIVGERVLLVSVKGTYLILGKIGYEPQTVFKMQSNKPDHDTSTQSLIERSIVFEGDKVIKEYSIIDEPDSNYERLIAIDKEMGSMDREINKMTPFTRANTLASRAIIKPMLLSEQLDAGELEDIIVLFSNYEINKAYKKDDIFNYNGELYKVIQGHTSLDNWKPNNLPALYWKVLPAGTIGEWVQPQGQVGMYDIGDKVIYNGKKYISIANNNVWKPGEYGWDEI